MISKTNEIYIKQISIKDFISEVPSNFIKSINNNFDINTVQIYKQNLNTEYYIKYYIETCCKKCFICKKNIDLESRKINMESYINKYNTILNNSIISKINTKYMHKLNKKSRVFTYESKINSNLYIQYEYNLCESCFNNSLYYWYITHDNKYPSTQIDGFYFIHKNDSFVPEIMSLESLEKIKKIKFIKTFVCNYYNNINNIYNLIE